MANAKKCDGCGRFYLTNTREKRKDKQNVCFFKAFDSAGYPIGDFDLCEDCGKKLYDFLFGKESEG